MTNTDQTVTATITFPFSNDDIDLHIMGSGFTMWSWWHSVQVRSSEGFVNIVSVDPNEDGEIGKSISYDDIRKVVGDILSGKHDFTIAKEQLAYGNVDEMDLDADGADQIMQIAMFGKVVYG